MEENGTYTLDLKQFRQLFPVSDCLSMGDDICVVNVRYDQNLKIMGHPCRFDGFLAVFCMSGGLRLTVNMTEFDLMKDSLFINLPGNIIRVSRPDVQGMEKLNFLVIAMTREFMGGFKVNMPKLIEKGMMLMSNPCIVLNEDEKAMARKYLRLAADVLKSNMMYKRESILARQHSIYFRCLIHCIDPLHHRRKGDPAQLNELLQSKDVVSGRPQAMGRFLLWPGIGIGSD